MKGVSGGFDRLAILFSRAATLPQLPGSALKLVRALDSEKESGATVERIITSDPALAASVIRAASSSLYGRTKVTTIRGAILRLGEKAVRSLAIALAMQTLEHSAHRHRLFNPIRSSKHALFIALMASTLQAQAESTQGNLDSTAEEVLATGILHDVHWGVLARIAPEAFEQCHQRAVDNGELMEEAFEAFFGQPAWKLSAMAMEAWGLPSLFSQALHRLNDPSRKPHVLEAAHSLATRQNCLYEDWALAGEPYPIEWAWPPAEVLNDLILVVTSEAEAFLQTTLAVAA